MQQQFASAARRARATLRRATPGLLVTLVLLLACASGGGADSSAPGGDAALYAQAGPGQQQPAAGGHQPAAGGQQPGLAAGQASPAGQTPAGGHEPAGHGGDPGAHGGGHGPGLGEKLPLWTVIPFVGILLSIALFPLLAPHFWHHHFPKVSVFWAVAFALPFLIVFKSAAMSEILHIYIIDYIPFIILLAALFTCSGGILLRGTPVGSPLVNVIFLAIGTVLASLIGTTGASMLMIRPVLRANAARRSKVHVIAFFIFLVSNIGGSLTPLGDPPLFLGFLHGVPFFWTMRLLPQTAFVSGVLLAVFFLWDTLLFKREQAAQPVNAVREPLRLEGGHNFIYLAGILGGVILSGLWHGSEVPIFGVHLGIQNIVRDLILIAMAVLAYVTTKATTRADNQFSWFPIKEVAILFFGIFMTIIPALAILKAGEQGALAGLIRSVRVPAHYFWASGSLSSFLDNAPTYLTFFNSALGRFYAGLPEAQGVARLIAENDIYLKAISLGAVYMGANSYIGNAPNFMVRSMAEEGGVKMPSFFGYMVKYSIPVLIPVFILVTMVFFR